LNSSQTTVSGSKRTLLQISATLDKRLGGPTSVVWELNTYLTKYFEHLVFVFGKSEFASDNIITIPTLKDNRFGFFAFPIRKELRIKIATADILLIHGYYLFSSLYSVAFSKTDTIFLMPHGSLEGYQEKRGKFRKRLFRLAMKIALQNRDIRFLVGSDAEVKSILAIFPRSQIDTTRLGIAETIAYGKNVLNDKHKPVRLLCFSRISKKKRIDLCIRALAELNKDEIRFRLTIVGTGDPILVEELKALCKKMNLDDQVEFRGHVAGEMKIRGVFEESDIFLLPSENENFAIAVSESIGFSVPVIVSKFVAMHDFVDEYSTGLTLENLSVSDLVDAILKVESGYISFRENCENFRGLLSWSNTSKNWLKVLLESEVSSDAR
jgi:glycosyltransferase involved in cell wall biosynthesis